MPILINVQYLQIVVFSFEKGLNGPKHSSSDSHQPIKQYPPLTKFIIPPSLLTVTLFRKPWALFKGVGQLKMKLIHFGIIQCFVNTSKN